MSARWECLADAQLLQLADRHNPDPGDAVHFRGCGHCRRRLARLQREQATMLALERFVEDDCLSSADGGSLFGVTDNADAELPVPHQVGRYPVRGRLARGGQAEVLLATHPSLGRDVALKLSHAAIPAGDDRWAAIEQEGRLLARLSHPALPTVYDCDWHAGRPFMALEFVDGVSLSGRTSHRAPAVRAILDLLLPLAEALGLAHDQGILHLDLKPDNVLIQADGRPKLVDFGAAGLITTPGEDGTGVWIVGTPEYMAPEQHTGDPTLLSPATDVYGLGGLLYFQLYGEPPHANGRALPTFKLAAAPVWSSDERKSTHEHATTAASRDPRRRCLEAICRRALAVDPAGRPQTARRFAQELQRLQTEARRSVARRTVAAALMLLGTLSALAAVVTGLGLIPTTTRELTVEPVIYRAGTTSPLVTALPLRRGDLLQLQLRNSSELSRLFVVLSPERIVHCYPLVLGEEERNLRFFPGDFTGWPIDATGRSLLILSITDEQPLATQLARLRSVLRTTSLELPDGHTLLQWKSDRRDTPPGAGPSAARADLPTQLQSLAGVLDTEFAQYHALVLRGQPGETAESHDTDLL